MAQVNISLDTETKELTINMGGKVIKNAQGVHIYREEYGDEMYFSLEICEQANDNDGIRSVTQYFASGEGKWDKKEKDKVDTKALASVLLGRKVE